MRIDFKSDTPLYKQIAARIRSDIVSGRLKPDEQLKSQQLLAKEYGVSLITIKRAVSDLAYEGLLFSRGRRGTYVRKPGSGNGGGYPTNSIGIVLRDMNSPFFSLIVQRIEAFASIKGYILSISNSTRQPEKEEILLRRLYDAGVKGLIVASMTHEYNASHYLRSLHEENYPLIMVSYIADPDIYFVGTDHTVGGYMATNHLISLGYKKIGYINGELNNVVGQLRKEGYIRALKEHNLPFREDSVFRLRERGEWHDYNSGYAIGEHFAALSSRPDAMFVYNDLAALGFEQAVLDHGMTVPDDVAIVGFDGIERGQYAPVPLTTIEQPFDQIGSLAVENLIKRIEGQPVNIKTNLLPTLVVRKSCGGSSSIRGAHVGRRAVQKDKADVASPRSQ